MGPALFFLSFMPVDPTLDIRQFHYDLPPELIAQAPAATRNASRLLHVDKHGELQDLTFKQLSSLLSAGDLLVFNNTKVIKARLVGHKSTGGKVEVLIERVTGSHSVSAYSGQQIA